MSSAFCADPSRRIIQIDSYRTKAIRRPSRDTAGSEASRVRRDTSAIRRGCERSAPRTKTILPLGVCSKRALAESPVRPARASADRNATSEPGRARYRSCRAASYEPLKPCSIKLWEHTFVTAQPSAHVRFRRAIEREHKRHGWSKKVIRLRITRARPRLQEAYRGLTAAGPSSRPTSGSRSASSRRAG